MSEKRTHDRDPSRRDVALGPEQRGRHLDVGLQHLQHLQRGADVVEARGLRARALLHAGQPAADVRDALNERTEQHSVDKLWREAVQVAQVVRAAQ
jgi:hypothetical protein